MTNVTIEVDSNSALARHIEELQRVISKRNKRIEELEFQLTGEGENERLTRIRQKAFSDGYKAASGNMKETARKFGQVLENIQREAFEVYLRGDKIGWDSATYEGAK